MKTVKQENNFLVDLEAAEMENIEGGGWRENLSWAKDFVIGLRKDVYPYGCGLGDALLKGGGSNTTSGGYLNGAYGHR
ncbi:hypothetical protein [Bacillus cytotoxicus]|uniref:hypothetical protein n=1 Tax=Bacillus cytotoxicus TaxID=580165 RepID=UPI000661587D|nr:hypothetical protein [Bacillus cytotoxicus]AWC34236.1 hypothetical protein CG482_018735 [Bacillus cytotoxicus]AWC38235.1 hypothetical protein CG481_018585 [Bacillus cytotoxicus]AWC62450.1 hypothetical protein CG474_018305 [Bacillus cytotoxicus]KMT48721.1 hypothetical protein TU51_17260 [Bacillus cytotoxicus]QTR79477.1 hypothetical protein JC773_02545 [Bacillus cytotoxicus]